MVIHCTAFGCNNIHDARKQISYHSFPLKRPEILKRWVEATRRENWWPSKATRLCGEHFLPSDYQVRPGSKVKLLKPDSVPSIFSFPKLPLKSVTPRSKKIRQDVVDDIKEDPIDIDCHLIGVELFASPPTSPGESNLIIDDLPSTFTGESNIFTDVGTQTNFSSDVVLQLKRRVKALQYKLIRRDAQISNMRGAIRSISKKGCSKSPTQEKKAQCDQDENVLLLVVD